MVQSQLRLIREIETEEAIAIRRRRAILIPEKYYSKEYGYKEDYSNNNSDLLFSFMENIASLGFTLSPEAIEQFSHLGKVILSEFLPMIIIELRSNIGDDVTYEPMYPGFPVQVREMSECELYLNAIIHYISGGNLFPYDEKYENIPKESIPLNYDQLKKLDIMRDKDLNQIFMNLISANNSISDVDKDDLRYFFNHIYCGGKLPEMKWKENLAFVAGLYLKTSARYDTSDISHWFKTATDVLRLYVAMSDGDVSLSSNTRFRNLEKREARLLMNLLAGIKDIEHDFIKYKEEWKRAGERIKPNSFRKPKYASVQAAFYKIRKKIKISNWSGELKQLINNNKWKEAIDKSSQRPGEYFRMLDLFFRKAPNETKLIISNLLKCAGQVSTPVLLQTYVHFSERDNIDKRVFFPKSTTGTVFVKEDEKLEPIDDNTISIVIRMVYNELISRFSRLPYLGKMYIDDSVDGFMAPFSQRSASKASRPCERGSRFKLKDTTKSLRPFIWWTNEENGSIVDIDLSASFYNEDFTKSDSVGYYNLRNNCRTVHSGDITNAGLYSDKGAAEFIEVEIDDAVKAGWRYVIMSVHVYSSSNRKFSDEFKCKAGYMEMEEFSGEKYSDKSLESLRSVFDASRVEMKMDIGKKSSSSIIPIVVDLETREVIWTDMTGGLPSTASVNNAITTANAALYKLYAALNMKKLSISELLILHATARGTLVSNKEEADVIYSMDEGITPFDLDIYMSEYMQ